MEKDKLLSVIVPVYNAENYLSYCVDSLLKQTYKKMEIILVENGSLDRSFSVCRRYAEREKNIKAYHLEDAGVSRARNFGIRQAEGSYVMFVDCDDYCEADYCARMLETVGKCGANCMPVCGFDRTQGYFVDGMKQTEAVEDAFEEISLNRLLDIFKRGMLNMLWNKIYDRAVILENNIQMREELSLGEDLLFNLEYLYKAGIERIYIDSKPLYHYVRSGRESLDNRYYKNLWELINLFLDEIKKYCGLWQIKDEDLYADIVYYYYMDLFQNTFSPQNETSIWEKFKQNKKIMKDIRFQTAMNGRYYIKGCTGIERWLVHKDFYICFHMLKKLKKLGKYIRRDK